MFLHTSEDSFTTWSGLYIFTQLLPNYSTSFIFQFSVRKLKLIYMIKIK